MILEEFESCGYHITYKILNASEFGVPQKRERVIIIGFREVDDFNNFSFPVPIPSSERTVLGDVMIETANSDESLFFSEKAVAGMLAVRGKMNKGRVMKKDEPL